MFCRKSLDLSEWILYSSIIVYEKITIRIVDLGQKYAQFVACVC
jgi:hypothetical protein